MRRALVSGVLTLVFLLAFKCGWAYGAAIACAIVVLSLWEIEERIKDREQ